MANHLSNEVNRLSGQRVELCYHCHKCTAGCPVVNAMSFGPDRVLRMAALNQSDLLLSSRDIWLCVGCYACATRCPNAIDVAAIMDALRQLSVRGGYTAGQPDTILFHRLFLGIVKRLGRSHEAFLLGLFKLRAQIPFMSDLSTGVALFMRGKVPILPQRSSIAEVRDIFKRSN